MAFHLTYLLPRFYYTCTDFNQKICYIDVVKNDSRKILDELQEISTKLENTNRDLSEEERIWKAELDDRRRQGLTGDAAIEHYNDWMDRHGMSHMKVPHLS